MNKRVKLVLGPIQPDEQISRYIHTEKYIRQDNTVRGGAFEESRENEFISVSRTSTLNEGEIWEIGRNIFANPAGKEIIGWASLSVRDAENNKFTNLTVADQAALINATPEIKRIDEITIEVRDTPYEENLYHADIEYKPITKSIMKHIAKKLAKSAQFIRSAP